MINVFKSGGDWKTKDGQDYTVKVIEEEVKESFLGDGWKLTLSEVFPITGKSKVIRKKTTSKA